MSKKFLNVNDDLTQIKFTAMLKTAVINKRITYINKRNNLIKGQTDFEKVEFSISDKEDFVQAIVDGDILKTAMDFLNEREKKVFYYHFIEDKSFFEIGEMLNLSYKGAATLYYRTIAKIKEIIRSIDDEF